MNGATKEENRWPGCWFLGQCSGLFYFCLSAGIQDYIPFPHSTCVYKHRLNPIPRDKDCQIIVTSPGLAEASPQPVVRSSQSCGWVNQNGRKRPARSLLYAQLLVTLHLGLRVPEDILSAPRRAIMYRP